MNAIWMTMLGAFVGWLASLLMRTRTDQGIFMDVVVGIVGALLAGILLSPLSLISPTARFDFSMEAVGISLLGSAILLSVINLLRKRSVR